MSEFYQDQYPSMTGNIAVDGTTLNSFVLSGVPASMISFLDAPSLEAIRAIVREEIRAAFAERVQAMAHENSQE